MNLENLADEFRANGFVVARELFEADLLQDVTAEVERVVDDVIASGGYDRMYFDDEAELSSGRTASAVRCVFRMQDLSDFLRNLLESPTLNDLARTLLGDEPVADGIQYIDKPPGSSYEFPYHQDNAYMFHEPPLALVATLALDGQPAESGPISCLRGSHVLEVLPHAPSGVLGASRGLASPPDTATFPEVAMEVEAGDVLIHHANVIHRTGPNHTPRATDGTSDLSITEPELSRISRPWTTTRNRSTGDRHVASRPLRILQPIAIIGHRRAVHPRNFHDDRASVRSRPSSSIISGTITSSVRAFSKPPQSICLLYTSPSPRDGLLSRMPSSA